MCRVGPANRFKRNTGGWNVRRLAGGLGFHKAQRTAYTAVAGIGLLKYVHNVYDVCQGSARNSLG